MNLNEFYELIEKAPPAFHYWDNQPQTGGISKDYFKWLETILAETSQDQMSGVETGAGLSTLFMLTLGYQCHSFGLPDTIDKISTFLSNWPVLNSRWSPHPGFSEFQLPKFAQDQCEQSVTFCFIDGSHALPSVFSDFCFMNYLLSIGGVIVVDDIQLAGPHILVQMLQQLLGDWQQIALHFVKPITGHYWQITWRR